MDGLIREALADGGRVGVLAATGSAPRERIAEAAFTVLPSDLARYTRLFVNGEAISTSEQPAPSLEAQMADAKARVRMLTLRAQCTGCAVHECIAKAAFTVLPSDLARYT